MANRSKALNPESNDYLTNDRYPENKNPGYFLITPQNQNPVFVDAVADQGFVKRIFNTFMETLVPIRYNSGLMNGWKDGWVEKIMVLLFAKPWAWLLLYTIVALFVLFILSLCVFILGLGSSSATGYAICVLTGVSAFACLAYLVMAGFFGKEGWKYEKKHYMTAKKYFNEYKDNVNTMKNQGKEARDRLNTAGNENNRVNLMSMMSMNNKKEKMVEPEEETNGGITNGMTVEDCMNIETSIVSN